MAANKEAGEVVLTLEGADYVLRPSYQAIGEIEDKLGLSLFQLASAAQAQSLTLKQMGTIAVAMIAAHGREIGNESLTRFSVDRVAELIHTENAMLAQGRLAIVLFGAATGGVDAQGKWKPAAVASRWRPAEFWRATPHEFWAVMDVKREEAEAAEG